MLLTEQEFVAVLPPTSVTPADGTITLQQLLSRELITRTPGTMIRDMLATEAIRVDCNFVPAVEVELRGSALHLAVAGVGTAVLPRPMAELSKASGGILLPIDLPQIRQMHLLRRNSPLSPTARFPSNAR